MDASQDQSTVGARSKVTRSLDSLHLPERCYHLGYRATDQLAIIGDGTTVTQVYGVYPALRINMERKAGPECPVSIVNGEENKIALPNNKFRVDPCSDHHGTNGCISAIVPKFNRIAPSPEKLNGLTTKARTHPYTFVTEAELPWLEGRFLGLGQNSAPCG